ncbi:MAG: 2-C-methyl-D-erythritol 4-phosphate cytidylyltransferase [Clostridia bacterium]|nr:2-C-methyl-D-erythritol 4-phosphate cytidylyltransferase [Clostridia bacterium]
MQYCTAILLAAGSGARFDPQKTKQTFALLGKSILRRSAETLAAASLVDALVVVVREDEMQFAERELSSISIPFSLVLGGKTRQESVSIGFSHISKDTSEVLIHDAARCLVTAEGVDAVVRAVRAHGAASAVSAVHDTVKLLDTDGKITSTIDRDRLCFAATPQGFSVPLYEKAWQNAAIKGLTVTDDNMLLEGIGVTIEPVYLSENLKITTREDLLFAEFLLRKRGISDE